MTTPDIAFPGLGDPRPYPSAAAPTVDSAGALRTAAAGRDSATGLWLAGGGAAVLGAAVFLWLSSHRAEPPKGIAAVGPAGAAQAAVPGVPAAPPELAAMEAASRGLSQTPAPPPMPMPTPAPAIVPQAPVVPPGAPLGPGPVLVVDMGEAPDATPTPAAGVGVAGAAHGDKAAGPTVASGLNGDEQFAARVSGTEPDRARATVLHNRGAVIAQGAIMPAVLETALNSDLPGFARAVVSRDVRSFDGSTVLIPRGSRVIGEYHNAVALGQSRAFVIWTRVLRPDGVSIQIGSPVTDPLGRGGVSGSVNRHFLQRFGGAILLSVINAGLTALSGTPSTEVVIGSTQEATSLATSASAFAPASIPPTITVPQGTPIRIFVARDLDFSSVLGATQ